jgi:4a-hydroxytetrahydrobiopterin dehydratase
MSRSTVPVHSRLPWSHGIHQDRYDGPVTGPRLKRQEISDAVGGLGWRLVLGELRAQVLTGSLAVAADLAARVAAMAGDDAGEHLRMDVRGDRVYLIVHSLVSEWPTKRDVELARAISGMVGELGLATGTGVGDPLFRSVQQVEIGIDALDVAAIRPFWRAVLGYVDDDPGAIADPAGQGPGVWFQQMDAPRPQRNRIHLDIWVPHDEAQRRIDAVLAVGGRLTYDAEAPAFWVLADPEGNEACICTWQGRDR